jgi:trans-aconitate methyltransferase
MSNFDDFASDYEERMRQTLSLALTSEEYQAEYKSKLIQRYASKKRKILNVLDYGCGVGLSVPSLKATFPTSEIYLTDVSKVSLEIASQNHPDLTVLSPELDIDQKFDVIFLSTVLHHITARDRVDVFAKLKSKLSENG